MRALILAAALFALGACRNSGQVDNNQTIDENLTAENIASNDVTAIDAVTGDASNMAAESSIDDIGAANLGDAGNAIKPAPKRPATTAPTEPATANIPAPTSNAASNTTN